MRVMESNLKIMTNIANVSIDAIASMLDTFGSVACVAGGMGIIGSQALNKTFQSAYFGSAIGWGGLDISGTLERFFSVNYTLPLQVSKEIEGETLFQVADYANANKICGLSMVLVVLGVILKALGSLLKKWQQYRYDEQFNQLDERKIRTPGLKEYFLAQATSLNNSFTIALLSYSLMGCLVYYADLLNSALHLTYPLQGSQFVNGTYYKGPVNSISYPIHALFDPQKVTIDIPFIGNITLLLDMVLNGRSNITVGGGVFFKENGPVSVPPVLLITASGIGGVSAYLASNFFSRKESRARDSRVKETLVHDEEESVLLNTSLV